MLVWLVRRIRGFNRYGLEMSILALLALVLVGGSLSFYYFERGQAGVESVWDAVYWVTVTITTVGFGDIFPRTPGGRITFALVALGGIGTIAYVVEGIVAVSTKRQLQKMFGLGAVKLKQHTVIAGWNTKTEEAISELKSLGEKFVVVGVGLDQAQMNANGIDFIVGDPTKSDALNRGNIKSAKTLLIPLENDSETIMVALAARKLNPSLKIVATCDLREHVEMMRGAGVDHVIPHTELGGRLLVHAVHEPVIVEFIMDASTSAGGIRLRQQEISEAIKLAGLALQANERVVALYRNAKFILDVKPDLALEKGDYLVIISST